MIEPMSAETDPRREQLDQKKEEIFDQLRRQNEALGGKAFTFVKKADGSEFVLFNYPAQGEDDYYQGGFDGFGTIMPKVKADLLIKNKDMTWEEVSSKYGSSMETRPVTNDKDRDRWVSSLKQSEEMAAEAIKSKRAEEHYTPLLLAAIGEMPNVLQAGGFDLYAEMRKMPAKTDEVPAVAPVIEPETQFGVAHAVPEDVARMDADSRNQAALDAQNTLGHSDKP